MPLKPLYCWPAFSKVGSIDCLEFHGIFNEFHVFPFSEFEVNKRFFPDFSPQHADLSNKTECRHCIEHGDENADFAHLSTRVLFAVLTLLQTTSKHDVGQPAMAKGCVCYLPS